jgi:hypothetical protein
MDHSIGENESLIGVAVTITGERAASSLRGIHAACDYEAPTWSLTASHPARL